MALKYRCRFCFLLEDAKHAIHRGRKHANLLGRLGPIFLVALAESDGKFHRMYVEVVSVGPSQWRRSCIAVNCSFLSTISGFPTLLRAYDTACPNAVFPELTAIDRSQLGCNDPRVSIMYGHETRTRLL